jgi:hypothetical protein
MVKQQFLLAEGKDRPTEEWHITVSQYPSKMFVVSKNWFYVYLLPRTEQQQTGIA